MGDGWTRVINKIVQHAWTAIQQIYLTPRTSKEVKLIKFNKNNNSKNKKIKQNNNKRPKNKEKIKRIRKEK